LPDATAVAGVVAQILSTVALASVEVVAQLCAGTPADILLPEITSTVAGLIAVPDAYAAAAYTVEAARLAVALLISANNAVSTRVSLAGVSTVVQVVAISIVAFFARIQHTVATVEAAIGRASVSVEIVAIVALFAAFQHAVAAAAAKITRFAAGTDETAAAAVVCCCGTVVERAAIASRAVP
jgi:hypothetical protein